MLYEYQYFNTEQNISKQYLIENNIVLFEYPKQGIFFHEQIATLFQLGDVKFEVLLEDEENIKLKIYVYRKIIE